MIVSNFQLQLRLGNQIKWQMEQEFPVTAGYST